MALKSKLWFVESIGQSISNLSTSFCLGSCSQTPGKCLLRAKLVDSPSWRFCGNQDSFKKIWLNSASTVILFDGASKGNPGASSARGLILSPDRLTSIRFSWRLGSMSNNQDGCYNLLLAVQLAKENGFKSVPIFGDSELLIKAMNSAHNFNIFALNIILQRIRIIMKDFEMIESFHILRDLNKLADSMANKACLLYQGFLSLNGETSCFRSIP